MNTTPTTPLKIPKIAVYHITTNRLANGVNVNTKSPSWTEANKVLAPLSRIVRNPGDAPIAVAYQITWCDGFKAEGTYEVKNGVAVDLAADIKRVWLYYAGFWRPNHMSEERHAEALAQNPQRQKDATTTLQKYALDDDPIHLGPVKPAVPTTPTVEFSDPGPTAEDFKLAAEYVARLLARVEEPRDNVNVNRALSLELRKSLAALLRAQQLAPPTPKA